MTVADEAARERFARELDHNFSVIASAGSGKTRAITDRIVQIAQSPTAQERLPQLVVVTYTNRAADEMQQRTRQQILEADLPLEIIEAFSRAFFGTIHSFCIKLLKAHGHHLGLPANLELITDDDDLWNQFVQQYTQVGRSLSDENRRVLLRHVQARQLMELARNYDGELGAAEPNTPCPDCDFRHVHAAVSARVTRIPKAQAELKRWEQRWRETDEFVPWPPCATTSKEFVERWREAFRPLRDWVNCCALCVAAEVQRDYRQFRLDHAAVTYADQIALAAELLRRPHVAERIREKNYRVILDEAQDTDPQQFFILLEIARPIEATGTWLQEGKQSPRPGHFCMVGDFQQSIYRDPADLNHYRELHRLLVERHAAEPLRFSVTFRLDQAQLDFVNATFAQILNEAEGQVQFLQLNPRPDVLPGQVVRFDLGSDIDVTLPETQRAAAEAKRLAEWVRETDLKKLRAQSWREVAILCPRKAWLRPLRDALLHAGLEVEVQSESDREAENPAYAWLTALLAIMVDPGDSYEIVGVLREVFGISDDELARFACGDGERFQIGERTRGRGLVPDALNVLARVRETIPQQPLFSAVREIVRMTQLRERLRSLPAQEFGELNAELDALLSAAGTAETHRHSLADFAQSLRRNYDAIRETHPSAVEAVQLITTHKAKGSEWDVVIVPFLAREVRLRGAGAYPRIIPGEQIQIAFDRSDLGDIEQELERIQRQEMERLLYVALTRARRTLVLAFDQEFFRGARGQLHRDSQIKWLRADADEPNAEVVAGLPSGANACRQTAARLTGNAVETVDDRLAALRLETGWIDAARQRAGAFIETVNPSKFTADAGEEEPVEAEEWIEVEPELRRPRIDNPATRYGLWWHRFVQQIVPVGDSASWEKIFQRSSEASPDVARGKREWNLLREELAATAELGRRLGCTGSTQCEMPFFWKMQEGRCLEGVMDVVWFSSDGSEALIIDWKTNRIAADKIEELRAEYRSQMAAYWRALTSLARVKADVAIYSTATGRLVVYDPDELASEWERLMKLPAQDMMAAVSLT